jgi:hypothetical protein
MKMTMHIDEEVLTTVMEITGAASKTEAVRIALNDITRRARFKKLAKVGLGLGPAELRNVLDEPVPEEAARVAEAPARYGAKRTRR